MPRKKAELIDIPLQITPDIYNKLQPILQRRGVQIQDIVQMYLRSLVTASQKTRAYSLLDEMPFGKFAGENIELIIRAEPRYMAWLIAESNTFHLEPSALELLNTILEQDRQ